MSVEEPREPRDICEIWGVKLDWATLCKLYPDLIDTLPPAPGIH